MPVPEQGWQRLSQRLAQLPPTFTTRDAHAQHLWPRDLATLRSAEVIYELSRGVWRKTEAPTAEHLDLLAVTRRAPQAIVCLTTALAVHELTDEIPTTVHIAVSRGAHRPHITYPMVTVSEFDPATFPLGRQDYEVSPGETVPIYSPARSVADAMRLRHRLGQTLALQALRRYLHSPQARPGELLELARALDVEGPVRTAAEAVLS